MPVPEPKDPKRDRHEPLPEDGEVIAAWRKRMKSQEAKEVYKQRAPIELATQRNHGLIRLLVRGKAKALAVALWQAIATT